MKNNSVSEPIRVADVIDGHIHPSLCCTQAGALLAVYNLQGGGGKELLLCRSLNGGVTWTKPTALSAISGCSIYPGSLTVLRDGRIVLNWCCYRDTETKMWREPHFSISVDEGETWSDPRSYPLYDHGSSTCMRHAVVELSDVGWICPFYDRTVLYDPRGNEIKRFGDGRNHGLVPIVRTAKGTLISGAPQCEAPVPVGVPKDMVYGLRSINEGVTWKPLNVFPHFGVAGYDLEVTDNDWIFLTYIVYGVGSDGEFSFAVAVSRDDGLTWDFDGAVEIYNPGRRIVGRGWPRTVQIDRNTLGTLFYDLSPDQVGGPGLYFVKTQISAFR